MKELVALKPKTQSYLKDNNDGDKKAKKTKNCVIKRKLKTCLEVSQIENEINHSDNKKVGVDNRGKN